MKPGFRLFPHTAELGLEVWGPDWPSFYCAAAQGLLSVYELTPAPRGSGRLHRFFRGETSEDVLVAWLSELNFLILARGRRPGPVSVIEAGPRLLRVELRNGRALRPPAREVKAVTYHDLRVDLGPQGLRARLILDV